MGVLIIVYFMICSAVDQEVASDNIREEMIAHHKTGNYDVIQGYRNEEGSTLNPLTQFGEWFMKARYGWAR